MNKRFSQILKQKRMEKELSQQQLADRLFVKRSSVSNWEAGRRVPDMVLLKRIADCLEIDISELLTEINDEADKPQIMVVDDESIILKGSVSVIKKLFPNANVTAFTSPREALAYATMHPVQLAFLDIEMGHDNGLELCRRLLELNAHLNVIYLTAYPEYSLEAWKTNACGFVVKPIDEQDIRELLPVLRFPVRGL